MYHGERFNSISHLVGAGMAVLGAVLLVVTAARLGDPWKIVSFSIYGAMLVALYVASTLYHSVRGPSKTWLQKFDHCSIYLLIAGSYTPFALVSLRGPWGWSLLAASVDAGRGRHRAGNLVCQGRARAVVGHLPADGLAGPGGGHAAVGSAHAQRVCLAGCGGVLYTVGVVFTWPTSAFAMATVCGICLCWVAAVCHFFTVLFFVA
jgi:hemolysin III